MSELNLRWKFHSGAIGESFSERIYTHTSGAQKRIYTLCNSVGEWGKGKVTYSFRGKEFDTEWGLLCELDEVSDE